MDDPRDVLDAAAERLEEARTLALRSKRAAREAERMLSGARALSAREAGDRPAPTEEELEELGSAVAGAKAAADRIVQRLDSARADAMQRRMAAEDDGGES